MRPPGIRPPPSAHPPPAGRARRAPAAGGARLIAVCEAAGLRCMVGSMVESTIATAAGVQVALARRAVVANGLVGPMMLREDLATGLTYADGAIRIDPAAPGLGITVDE